MTIVAVRAYNSLLREPFFSLLWASFAYTVGLAACFYHQSYVNNLFKEKYYECLLHIHDLAYAEKVL